MNPPRRILVVDDDETIRAYMQAALSADGYQVVEASNGFEALELVEKSVFDVIVVDWLMPKLDGCTFLELYARLPNQRAAVILCSAVPAANLKISGNEPAAFLLKPFGVDDLRQAINHCLR